MAAPTLKSCQQTLDKLKEIQTQSSNDAKEEYQRVKKAHEKFETLRDQFISKYINQQKQDDVDKSANVGTNKKMYR